MKWPPKREGALQQAPIPRRDWTETTSPDALLQACEHRATVTERLPDTHRHYARLTCAVCGRFLRWLLRPETIERQRLNAFRLAKLAMHPGLSDWERRFVGDVLKLAKLSPRQQALVERLCREYLEKGTP